MGIVKLVAALVVGLMLTLVCSGAALADQGPHSQYSQLGLTEYGTGCQSCHAAHRGEAAYLLRGGSTIYEVCTTCHSESGVARTDVINGAFTTGSALWGTPDEYGADDPLNTPAVTTKQLNGGLYGGGATSMHRVLADDEDESWVQYGLHATDAEDAANPVTDFKCTSCHDPHGKQLSEVASSVLAQANGRPDNYRLLKAVPVYTWEDTNTTGNTDPDADKSYTKAALEDETGESDSGISVFCASCHIDYRDTYAPSKGGGLCFACHSEMFGEPDYPTSPNAPGGVRYVHLVDVSIGHKPEEYPGNLAASRYPLPVAEGSAFRGFYQTSAVTPTAPYDAGPPVEGADYSKWVSGSLQDASYDPYDEVTCLTCHNAHGSVATGDAGAIAQYNIAGTHSLLRFDERAVCQSCHKKNPSYP